MGILIAYFVFIASTLAVIVTSWIGVADSGVAGLHLQRASAIQQSYDTSVMAEDPGDTPVAVTKAAARNSAAEHGPVARLHARAHLVRRRARDFGADPHLALRGTPPPDDGH